MSGVCYNKGADKFEVDEDYKVKNNIDFTTITACGECCVGCKKKEDGICQGCIESDGYCMEWTQSNGCPIHKCAREHKVQFCGLCEEFPCDWLFQNELSAKAHELYNNYKTPDKEKKNIIYWLSATKSKLLSAIKSNDNVKISYLVSTNTWKVLEGVWAINNKPIPPSSLAFSTYSVLSLPLDNWFEGLFVEDTLSRANTMITIIDIICK